jgi:hypothetical protein
MCSRGLPLEPAVRAFFEKQFNRNFDFVRVHCDEKASRSARLLNARAYTIGSHIVFAEGLYNPETRAGQWLLAHEMTHVVQQGSGRLVSAVELSKADHPLEHIADQAADIIVSGCSLPQDFVFGSTPEGVVQCHIVPNDPTGAHFECPGYAIESDALLIQGAERTIEIAYRQSPGVGGIVVYGSDDLEWPQGVTFDDRRRTAFVTELLTMLRERPVEQRPNILNFTLREAYFFRRQSTSDAGIVRIINDFHRVVDRLAQRHQQQRWASGDSNWYPNHVLPLIGDRFVCTQATVHEPPRGLILYDIRGPRKRRRQRRTSEIRMLDFWRLYGWFRQMVRSNLPTTIPVFDPDSPDYVIIVPDEFIRNPKMQKMMEANMQPEWDKFRVDSWMSRNRLTLDPRAKNFYLGLVIIVGVAAIVVITGGMAAPEAVPTASVVAVEVAPPASMIVPVAKGAAAPIAATTGEVISMAAWKAARMAPAVVDGLMKAAGVVLVIGFVDVAQAGGPSATLESATAIRVVPINDFTEKGGQLYADSSPVVPNSMYTMQQFKQKFSIGTKVYFDNKQHWILGQVKVR